MKIIKDVSVFDSNYVPEKLPVRQDLVDEIATNIEVGGKTNFLITGVSGNGKTVSVRKATDKLKNSIIPVYVNCFETNTYISIGKRIMEGVRNKPYNDKGKRRDDVADDLKKLLTTKRSKRLVFVFDEIDKLIKKKDNHWEILFVLLNHGSANFILISNETDILGKINSRIIGRLSPQLKILETYAAGEIYQILDQRARNGLIKDSYDAQTLMKISKFGADVSGDIRLALNLLEQSAIKTQVAKESKISEKRIQEAIKEIQVSDIEKIFPTLQRHLKWVIVSLCANVKPDIEYAITYPDSYNTYKIHVKNEPFGAVGDRQYRDYLKALETLGLFDFYWKSPGNRRGRVRIAIPRFDYKWLLNTVKSNNGEEASTAQEAPSPLLP